MEKDNKPTPKKINLKIVGLIVAIVIVVGLGIWCGLNATKLGDTFKFGKFGKTFSIFMIAFVIVGLGYLLGRVTIKGISLGTAGVFLVAILIGWICTIIPKDIPLIGAFGINESDLGTVSTVFGGAFQNIGLILFVGAVGFIAGPNFFKNLKKNFKTYILLGAIIILSGTFVAVICTLITPYGPEFWSGVLSGALTSTPGFTAAQEAAAIELKNIITLGHAIAYPFGVVGVVLFVQLMPKFLKVDMAKERALLKTGDEEVREQKKGLFEIDLLGLGAFAIAIVAGLLLGSITIPLTGEGYSGPCFNLGTTGGVLIMCLIFGHFGNFGKLSLHIPSSTLSVFKEFGLMLFLLGAGFEGGVNLVTEIANAGGGAIVAWGFIGGAIMTVFPLIVGFFVAKYLMKLSLLNNLGSITGGMTSTPALGTLIKVSETDDVASAYASTYPIALVLIVLASQLMIVLM